MKTPNAIELLEAADRAEDLCNELADALFDKWGGEFQPDRAEIEEALVSTFKPSRDQDAWVIDAWLAMLREAAYRHVGEHCARKLSIVRE